MTLPIRPSKLNAGLLDLPAEVISEVCCSLCFHCQQRGTLVEATSAAVRAADQDQQAISRLSRCSKLLRNIALPVLFHWYHGFEREDYPRQLKRLASFVCTIIRKPGLAASVKALALYTLEYDSCGSDEEQWAQRVYDADGIYQRAVEAIGGHLLQRCGLHPSVASYPLVEDLQELAMAISPGPFPALVRWQYDLSRLAYLAFPGVSEDSKNPMGCKYHIVEAKALLRHTPNLWVLVAPDWSGSWGDFFKTKLNSEPWDVALPKLRKLSLNGLNVQELDKFLLCCPVLEDLEYFDDTVVLYGVLSPDRPLGHLRATLRRFRSGSDGGNGSAAVEDDGDDVNLDDARQVSNAPMRSGLSFSSFPVLEQLELEQLPLYGLLLPSPVNYAWEPSMVATPAGFLAKQPPSLRHLRIGYIIFWPILYRDLLALAAEQPAPFPRLEAVKLEVFRAPPRDEHRRLLETFRSVNVSVSVCRVAWTTHSRGLLPARPGYPRVVRRPLPEPLSYP
ncbi:hypothetical protein VTK56DRAFT_6605 [Thermocarpiscus australiensis]